MILTDDIIQQHNEALEARRYGKFFYSKAFLETAGVAIQKIFAKIIPVEVSYDFAREVFEVTALCDEFDPVEPSHMIPYYAVQVKLQKRSKGGTGRAYYINFQRIEME